MLFISLQVLSQEDLEVPLEDIHAYYDQREKPENIIEDLGKLKREVYEQVIKNKKARFKVAYREALKLRIQDILSSDTFYGLIRKGSRLVKLEDDSFYYTTKDIFVQAFKQKDFEGFQYLKNKDGSVSYKALVSNVAHIDRTVNLYEEPIFWKPVNKKDISTDIDKNLSVDLDFEINLGLVSANYLKSISQSNVSASINSYSLKSYADWNFPISLGAMIEWERLSGQTTRGDLQGDSLFTGFILRTPKFYNDLYCSLVTKVSLISNMTEIRNNDNNSHKFSKSSIGLNLHHYRSTFLGRLVFGFQFQRQWSISNTPKFAQNINANSAYDDIITLSIGLNQKWLF